MKVTATILMMYFGLLMAQPFLNTALSINNKPNSCHSHEMCCNEKAQHKGEQPVGEKGTTCNRDFCNPFVPCGISLVYRAPLLIFSNTVIETSKKLKPAINEDIISNYLSDCWRPPEQLS
ncbi:MAG: hypothetical protein ACXVB6_14910 [Mucilaginibacter sp.]